MSLTNDVLEERRRVLREAHTKPDRAPTASPRTSDDEAHHVQALTLIAGDLDLPPEVVAEIAAWPTEHLPEILATLWEQADEDA
jgi:hypothetical protein